VASLQARLALARSTTDRVAEHRGDDAWLAGAWADPATGVVLVGDGQLLADPADGSLVLLRPEDAPDGERFLLGVDADGRAFFAVRTEGAPELPASTPTTAAAEAVGLRELAVLLDDRDAGLAVLAVGLANWHATHRHCPRCGAATAVAQAGFVRVCTADGSEHYPRTDPAIIVLTADPTGERALLGSSARWGGGRRYSTLAGFVEPGESAEAAVAREVYEESGVVVAEATYLGSQPWPFPSSLMLGFVARAADGVVPRADGDELVDVRWFTREEIRGGVAEGTLVIPGPVSIARRLLEHWYGEPIPETPGRW
jgi:NAD+ diphosphatase